MYAFSYGSLDCLQLDERSHIKISTFSSSTISDPQLLIVSSRVPSGQMDGVAHIIYHKTSVKKYFLDAAAWSIVQQKHVIKFELLTYFLVNYEIHRAILRKKALLNTVNRFSDVCLSNRIWKILLYVPHCLFDQVGFLS